MTSPLTEAFTPAEKEGLGKFKADYLERALKEAASHTSSTVENLEIWGVPIAQDDPRQDVIIVKFLRAKYSLVLESSDKVNWYYQRRITSLSRL
jgi:hypothetical protein